MPAWFLGILLTGFATFGHCLPEWPGCDCFECEEVSQWVWGRAEPRSDEGRSTYRRVEILSDQGLACYRAWRTAVPGSSDAARKRSRAQRLLSMSRRLALESMGSWGGPRWAHEALARPSALLRDLNRQEHEALAARPPSLGDTSTERLGPIDLRTEPLLPGTALVPGLSAASACEALGLAFEPDWPELSLRRKGLNVFEGDRIGTTSWLCYGASPSAPPVWGRFGASTLATDLVDQLGAPTEWSHGGQGRSLFYHRGPFRVSFHFADPQATLASVTVSLQE